MESTVYGGLIVPGPQRPAGMLRDLTRAPGMYAALASRSRFLWGGVRHARFPESDGDRTPELFSYSLVWGYQPPPLQKEYPDWDWRRFVELTGEKAGRVIRRSKEHPLTGGHQIFIGPTTLGIYKNIAIEGGVQLPVRRNVRSAHQPETFRYALNFF